MSEVTIVEPKAVALAGRLSQRHIYMVQDKLKEQAPVQTETEHLWAHGVYLRVLKVPADTVVVGECHGTEHITLLLKGSCTITEPRTGELTRVTAPMYCVTPAGEKKMVLTHEECWFANVHPDPDNKRDEDEVRQRVIIPETDHRLAVTKVAALT